LENLPVFIMKKRFPAGGGGKPLFRETLHMANKGVGKYRVDNAATIQSLYHFYPILH